MDVLDLKYEANKYDLIIDKSTMDAILCGENSFVNVAIMLKEINRTLKEGGLYLIISYGLPENRVLHLQREYLNFEILIYTITKDFVLDDLEESEKNTKVRYLLIKTHFVYICKKLKNMNDDDMKKYEETLEYLIDQEKQESEYYKKYINNKEENYIHNYKYDVNDNEEEYEDDENNIHCDYEDEEENEECDVEFDENIYNKIVENIDYKKYSKELNDYDNNNNNTYLQNLQDDDSTKLLQETLKNIKPIKKNNQNEEDDLKSLENKVNI